MSKASPVWSVEKSFASAVADPSAVNRTAKVASDSNNTVGSSGSGGGIIRARTSAPAYGPPPSCTSSCLPPEPGSTSASRTTESRSASAMVKEAW